MKNIKLETFIENSHHVTLCGKTGCGKTYIAKRCFFRRTNNLRIFVDTQMQVTSDKLKHLTFYDSLSLVSAIFKFARKRQEGYVIYIPNFETKDELDFILDLWKANIGRMIEIYIDEVSTFSNKAYIPMSLKTLYSRGRPRKMKGIALDTRYTIINNLMINNSSPIQSSMGLYDLGKSSQMWIPEEMKKCKDREFKGYYENEVVNVI